MLTKILLLAAVVALTWWWTRPWTTRRINRKKTETLVQCPHCGVYNAPNITCKCQQSPPD